MEELNKQIKNKEEKLLELRQKLNETKRQKDLIIMNKTTELENKYKETKDSMISNNSKRESFALQEQEVKDMLKKVEELEKDIKSLEIEVRYDIRAFNLGLAQMNLKGG